MDWSEAKLGGYRESNYTSIGIIRCKIILEVGSKRRDKCMGKNRN